MGKSKETNEFNGRQFKAFVKEILEIKAAEQKKQINFDHKEFVYGRDDKLLLEYDAIAPDGFEEYEGVVIFMIKANKKALKEESMDATNTRFKNRGTSYTLIFIVNYLEELDDDEKPQSNNVFIWDRNKVLGWAKEYILEFHMIKNSVPETGLSDEDGNIRNAITARRKACEKLLVNNLFAKKPFAMALGAGVSQSEGAESWEQMITRLEKRLVDDGKVENPKDFFGKIGGSSLTTAQLFSEAYDEPEYLWTIHQAIYLKRTSTHHVNEEMQAIARLAEACKEKNNFRVLTYNYDEFFEEALESIGVEYSVLKSDKAKNVDRSFASSMSYCMSGEAVKGIPIYHVHGFLPKAPNKTSLKGTICLTEADYNLLYNQPYSWPIVAQMSFFRENICLFIGVSLVDPNVRRLLELARVENHWHYALMSMGGLKINEIYLATAHFYRLGVRVIWIEEYDEIPQILEYFRELLERQYA